MTTFSDIEELYGDRKHERNFNKMYSKLMKTSYFNLVKLKADCEERKNKADIHAKAAFVTPQLLSVAALVISFITLIESIHLSDESNITITNIVGQIGSITEIVVYLAGIIFAAWLFYDVHLKDKSKRDSDKYAYILSVINDVQRVREKNGDTHNEDMHNHWRCERLRKIQFDQHTQSRAYRHGHID